MEWNTLANKETIQKTIESLKANGINAEFVSTGKEAKKRVLEIIPTGAEVMTMSSTTLDNLEISKEVQQSEKYNSVKNKLNSMNRETEGLEMKKIGSAPEWSVGSVNALTEEGQVLIASNTGSQLAAYATWAAHVIWVVGAQKIVKKIDGGMKRIYDYVLPLESVRANKAYNQTTGSNVSKLLIINKEIKPDRITLIIVGEELGF